MLEKLIIEGTGKTPAVTFSYDDAVLEISGKSIPENSFGFYQPMLNWIDTYGNEPKPKTHVKIMLEYFNTSSSKCLLDIFRKLGNIQKSGKSEVEVSWHYEEDDEDMMEAGQDYNSLVDLTFKLVQI
jgi:SiaC family regulatory phosphoprotein